MVYKYKNTNFVELSTEKVLDSLDAVNIFEEILARDFFSKEEMLEVSNLYSKSQREGKNKVEDLIGKYQVDFEKYFKPTSEKTDFDIKHEEDMKRLKGHRDYDVETYYAGFSLPKEPNRWIESEVDYSTLARMYLEHKKDSSIPKSDRALRRYLGDNYEIGSEEDLRDVVGDLIANEDFDPAVLLKYMK